MVKAVLLVSLKVRMFARLPSVLLKLSRRRRYQVREITLDMAPNMEQIARTCFPAAKRVTDRFHVQKLAYEAVQEMRVKARWEALDEESIQIAYAKAAERCIMRPIFANGGTRKTVAGKEYLICFTKKNLYGLSLKGYGPRFYLKNIPI